MPGRDGLANNPYSGKSSFLLYTEWNFLFFPIDNSFVTCCLSPLWFLENVAWIWNHRSRVAKLANCSSFLLCYLFWCFLWHHWKAFFSNMSAVYFFSGEATKFGRNDSSSPAPPTSLSTAGVQSQPQQAPQAGTQGQGQGQNPAQQTQNQAFLNPPLPPGYGYTGKETLFFRRFRHASQSIYFYLIVPMESVSAVFIKGLLCHIWIFWRNCNTKWLHFRLQVASLTILTLAVRQTVDWTAKYGFPAGFHLEFF